MLVTTTPTASPSSIGSSGLSVSDAAAMLLADDAKNATPTTPATPGATATPAETSAAPAAERKRGADGKFVKEPVAQAEPTAEPTPGTVEEEEEPAPVAAEGEEDQDGVPPVTFKVKIDGQEVDVPVEELRQGYSRTQDYTRKTQALAADRKAFDADRTALATERQTYAERLKLLEAVVPDPGQEPDWGTLAGQLSPEEFTQRFGEFTAAKKRMETVRSAQAEVHQRQVQEAERNLVQRVQQEHAKMAELFPDWADPAKRKTFATDLSDYAKSLGFNDEEVGSVYDHRLLNLLEKGRKWDESQRRRPAVDDKISKTIDAIRPSSAPTRPRQSDIERGRAKLAASGRVDDAASLLAAMAKK